MTIEIKYVVVRQGVEKMTFTSKKEADAYDKLLDTVDELTQLLANAPVALGEGEQELLALYLAEQKDLLMNLFKGHKANKPATTRDGDLTSDNPGQLAQRNPLNAKGALKEVA